MRLIGFRSAAFQNIGGRGIGMLIARHINGAVIVQIFGKPDLQPGPFFPFILILTQPAKFCPMSYTCMPG